ncbi:uncharacterized protein LOC113855866 [Abrus precatorius]|uniref:Uncharacterized protein LOC113855866 n=1 Tax=Abrus precatorius TaxID=3816 RepID=A0A8B8KJ58_ABRPR|nr:uncharacterized protein LOC113855866 [Abrus precatorius]
MSINSLPELSLLCHLLGNSHVMSQLPSEFRNVLRRGKKHLGLKVFAEAFKMIGNPLVVARLRNTSEILCPDAVHVDFTICQQRELVLQVLFPSRVDSVVVGEASDSTSKEYSSVNCSSLSNKSSVPVSGQTSDSGFKCDINMSLSVDCFWDMLENLHLAVDELCLSKGPPNSAIIKEFLNTWIERLSCLIHGDGGLSQNPAKFENKNEMEEMVSMLDETKQLSSALSVT